MSCHGFQSRMAATVRDEDGWRDRVSFMREAMRSSLADRQGFSDAQAEDVVSYLTTMFGESSPLPKSPADLPGYKDTLTTFSDEALKIVYVDFEMPGPNRFPWTANPDQDGLLLDSGIRRRQQGGAAQSLDRRDQGISRAQSRPGADPFGSAGARRLGLDHRGRLQEARPLGSRDPEDHRIPGRLAQAHRAHPPGRIDLVDGRIDEVRSQDRRFTPTSRKCRHRTASRSTRRAPSGSPR